VLILITDGETTPRRLMLEQTIRRVQQLSGPVIYSIGLLFGDEMSRAEVRHARRALEMLSTETGGIAFFPKSIEAELTRSPPKWHGTFATKYTLGYHSEKPTTEAGVPAGDRQRRGQGARQAHRAAPGPAISRGAGGEAGSGAEVEGR